MLDENVWLFNRGLTKQYDPYRLGLEPPSLILVPRASNPFGQREDWHLKRPGSPGDEDDRPSDRDSNALPTRPPRLPWYLCRKTFFQAQHSLRHMYNGNKLKQGVTTTSVTICWNTPLPSQYWVEPLRHGLLVITFEKGAGANYSTMFQQLCWGCRSDYQPFYAPAILVANHEEDGESNSLNGWKSSLVFTMTSKSCYGTTFIIL